MYEFDNQKIRRSLEESWISRSKRGSQPRMRSELKTKKANGYKPEYFEDYGVKKIVMRSPQGELYEITE